MTIFLNLGVLALVAGGAWWLTGVDKTAGGESKRSHHLTRALRCIMVLLLAAAFIWFVEQPAMGFAGLPFLIIIPVSIALILRSSVSELFTHGLLQLMDPTLHDHRPLDPGKSRRYLDTIAHLIKNGQRDEAIKLCEELKQSGEVDIVTLETTLEFLGVKQERTQSPKPLVAAAGLRAQGKLIEAEQLLTSLLAKKPEDVGAAMMLMRLYAQDFRQPSKAAEVLRQLEQQTHISASHVEFARRSIADWSQPKPKEPETVAPTGAASIEELLEQRYFGTAIEILEEKIKVQPQDFGLRLKLAEVYAVHCHNYRQAEKLIRLLETGGQFSSQQIASARSQLQVWSVARPSRQA